MKKRFLLAALFLLLSTSVSFGWQIEPLPADSVLAEPEEEIIINLVFVSLNYPESSDFEKDIYSITARLKSIFPFNEFKGFSFFLLTVGPEEKQEIFKQNRGFPYLKVRDDFISELNNAIGGNYKLVILNKDISTSAAELSKANETSLIILGRDSFGKRNRLAKAFLHEFGHSLGLKEESAGSGQTVVPGEPNCAPDRQTAVKWWGDLAAENSSVGYFEVKAGGKTYIKPTLRSIMNNPFKSYGYGPVNERYLRRELGIGAESL